MMNIDVIYNISKQIQLFNDGRLWGTLLVLELINDARVRPFNYVQEAFADEKGLVSGHAYTITGVAEVAVDDGAETVQILRVRNPWGNATEWTGDWGDDE
jgi:hypothetical protein